MKIKFTSIITLSAGLIIGAQAQATPVMVAGWDFSPFAFDQFSSVDGVNLQGFLPANFTARPSDGLGLPNFTGAPAFGTLYYDGTNGSTAFDLTASDINPRGGQRDLGLLGGTGSIGAGGNINTLVAQGQQFGNAKALSLRVNGSITYAIDMSTFPLGSFGEDWSLRFAQVYVVGPGDTSNSATIAWDYSLDGSNFVSTGIVSNLGTNAVAEVVDLSSIAALEGVTQAYFRGNFAGIGTGAAYVDNFQVFAAPMDASTGGSLFFLSNPASSLLADNWYFTPLGKVFVGSEPWLWSPQFGWFFSPPENTSEAAFIYIAATPFQTWVYVDQTVAVAEGFWGFAFDPAADADVAGWFWFFNESSENTVGKFFLWDLEGNQVLSFDDQSR